MRSKPCTASIDSNLGYRNSLTSVVASRTPGQINLHGFQEFAAAERRPRRASTEKDLVDVVVQYGAEPFKVVPAELNADAFRDRVADRVGMADALALNDFDIAVKR